MERTFSNAVLALALSAGMPNDLSLFLSANTSLPHHRTGGQRAHRAWKKRRASGRAK